MLLKAHISGTIAHVIIANVNKISYVPNGIIRLVRGGVDVIVPGLNYWVYCYYVSSIVFDI